MNRKISSGLYVAAVLAVLLIAGILAYLVNAGTAYYTKMGVDTVLVACLAAAAGLTVLRIIIGFFGTPAWADILPVAVCVLTVIGFMLLVNARVNNLAAVFTYENSASNMADTASCIAAIVLILLAVVVSMVSAFSDITKPAKA